MTSRTSKKSAEQAVLNRRLRPIYDAIDSGQNKKAVQEAEKVLKKHPNTQTAKVLKALSLIRLEKVDESRPIIHSIEKEIHQGIVDENTLLSLCHCYKEMYEPEKIVELYKSLSDQYKGNENHLTNLFFAFVRVRNYKSQQKVAVQLGKEFGQLQYSLWAVISTYMQGLHDKKLGDSMYFPLAEKMLLKVGYDPSFEMSGGYDLHLMILETRKKFADAADFIESRTLSIDAVQGTKLKLHLDELYRRAGNHNVVIARSICALDNDPSDWAVWTNLLDSAFCLMENESSEDERNRMLKRLGEVLQRAIKICKSDGDPVVRRGPLLARLSIIERLRKMNNQKISDLETFSFGSPLNMLSEIADEFYNKSFCFHDLSCYIGLLDDEENQMKFLAHIRSISKKAEEEDKLELNGTPKSINAIWADVLYEQCVWCFKLINENKTGEKVPVPELHLNVKRMVSKIKEAEEKGGLNVQIALYANLIVFSLWGIYVQNGDWRIVFAIICFLESLYEKYPALTPFPLILCRLYPILGNTLRVFEYCNHVKIRFIQKDSLGFIQFFLPERFGRFKTAIIQYTTLGSMYDLHEREISECLVHAYKNNSFLKIPKIVDLLHRSVNSLFATGSDVMNQWLSACFSLDSFEAIEATLIGDGLTFQWDDIVDNRDFSIMPSIALPEVLEQVKRDSFDEIKDLLRLRHLLCRAVGLIAHYSTRVHDFRKTKKQLFSHLKHCRDQYSKPSQLAENLISFTNVNVHEWVTGDILKLPLFILKISFDLDENFIENDVNEVKDDGLCSKVSANQNGLNLTESSAEMLPSIAELEAILEVYSFTLPSKIDVWNVAKLLEKASNCLEVLALSLFAVRFLERLLTNAQNSIKSKDKEKSEEFCSEILSSYTNLIFARVKEIKSAFVLLDPKYSFAEETFTEKEDYLEKFIKENSLLETAACLSLETSHRESIAEIQSAITHLIFVLKIE